MNLHKIASGVISAVNPMEWIVVISSNGYTTGSDGKRVPSYLPGILASAQVQQLTGRDLRQLEMMNIQGSDRKVYITGFVDAITRLTKSGGDLIVRFDESVWLTTHVLEQWPSWCAVSVTMQIDSALAQAAVSSAKQIFLPIGLDYSQGPMGSQYGM
jgi:hypothetical protein